MTNYNDPRQYDWNTEKISPDPRNWGSDEDKIPCDDEQPEDESEDNFYEGSFNDENEGI